MIRLAAIALAISPLAAAAEGMALHLDPARCAYRTQGAGEWWRGDGYTTADPQSIGCGSLAVSRPFTENTRLKIGYSNLGKYRIAETALGDGTGIDPHWVAVGYSETQGVTLGLSRSWSLAPWLSATLEGGAFAYRAKWQATAYHVASNVTRENVGATRYGLAPYLGGALEFPMTRSLSFTLGARWYRVQSNRTVNTPDGGSENIGYRRAEVFARTIGLKMDF